MSITEIPIYVINLDRSTNRLSYMDKQLSKLKMPFTRIAAIDGSQIQHKILQGYQQQSKHSWVHYTSLSAAEIGCALSWHNAWRIVSTHSSKACVVLEDDVKIHDNFKNVVEILFQHLDENIVIDLSGKKGMIEKQRKIINGITLIRYQTPPLRTTGSIYGGGNATKNFLNRIQHFKAPVDTLQQMLWLHNVQTWSLDKGCISHQDFEVGGSTISTKKKLSTKIKTELSRPLWRAWIIIRNFFI